MRLIQRIIFLFRIVFWLPISASAFTACATNHLAMSKATTLHSNTDECASTSETPSNSKNPIDIFGIDHVVLLVDDLAGMSEWYQTVLGCKLAKHNEKFQMIHLDAGSALIDLVDKEGPLGTKNKDKVNDNVNGRSNQNELRILDHLCLGLTTFDEASIREHLAAHGVPITTDIGTRYGKAGYGESLYIQDPEGTTIELRKSLLL